MGNVFRILCQIPGYRNLRYRISPGKHLVYGIGTGFRQIRLYDDMIRMSDTRRIRAFNLIEERRRILFLDDVRNPAV